MSFMRSLEDILSNYDHGPEDIIEILHEVQSRFNHIPKEAIEIIHRKTHIPKSRIYAIATFYKAFSLKPRGEKIIRVCMGTACHLKGAPSIVDEIKKQLGISPGEVTKDKKFSLELVNCVGSCSMAPVVVIDDKYHGQMTRQKIRKLLKQDSEGGILHEV